MKMIIAAAIAALSISANATTGPALIENLSQAELKAIELQLKKGAQKQTGFSDIRNFKVDWNEVKECIEVRSEMDESKLMGVCTVTFGGWQVQGQAAVIVKYNGWGVSIINVDVE